MILRSIKPAEDLTVNRQSFLQYLSDQKVIQVDLPLHHLLLCPPLHPPPLLHLMLPLVHQKPVLHFHLLLLFLPPPPPPLHQLLLLFWSSSQLG